MAKQSAKKKGKVRWIFIIVVLLVLFGEVMAYTWCRVKFVSTQYQIGAMIGEGQRLMLMQDNLKIELARLRSPERIAKYAREQCGLTMPTAGQFRTLP